MWNVRLAVLLAFNYQLFIVKNGFASAGITATADEITAEVLHTLRHGAARILGTGAYSEEQKEILICVVNRHQLMGFQKTLQKYDGTFSFSEMVNETYGNFAQVK